MRVSKRRLSKLEHLIASGHPGFRYQYFGVMVEEAWLFKKGGRPVIYQPIAERTILSRRMSHTGRYRPSADTS